MHQLGREPGRGPERAELLPAPGAVAGLLLQLAPGRQLRILDGTADRVAIQRPGGDLEQRSAGRLAPLAHEQEAVRLVERDDGHRARVAHHVAPMAAAIGALGRLDSHLQVAPAMDDLGRDQALREAPVDVVAVP